MLLLLEEDIQVALGRLERGMMRYQWLQANVLKCNVGTDRDFHKAFQCLLSSAALIRVAGSVFRIDGEIKNQRDRIRPGVARHERRYWSH